MANPFTTGEDVDDIINANGGVGEWEQVEATATTERWQFPRFPGADKIGQCDTEGEAHRVNHTETKKCTGFSPDPGNLYLSRSGIGYDTDVETIVGWAEAPRNVVGAINLLGEPGTGKTALVEAAATHADANLHTWLCTPDDTRDSLFLRFVGEGKGDPVDPDEEDGERSPYVLGPVPMAAKHGWWLYMDEWMLLVDGVKPVLYSLADGRRFLPGGNVDGSPMEIHPDFRLILSSNPLVRGASMPEPMASRCASTTVTVETTAAMLRDLDIDESVVAAWEGLKDAGLWQPQIREMRLADYWLSVNPTQAASAFLPEHCPESQRSSVRDIVVANLGSHLRTDGRLVVS